MHLAFWELCDREVFPSAGSAPAVPVVSRLGTCTDATCLNDVFPKLQSIGSFCNSKQRAYSVVASAPSQSAAALLVARALYYGLAPDVCARTHYAYNLFIN
ncbi:hypothetical protein EVAR_8216_1 [Eumeta japonica]|uniref:Uncharacterized protein n=1 Tax=Eumeta variegata TaxID=151549 RepID=A0A4C1TGP8_EUMVA|nr:hypothetical protein EVAR_8216_1 [Eumeta japonica]